MASIKIPDSLKADMPPTLWGKVLGATPVIMTVIATMLAGLSSSEMTKAQYARSSAAQLQSKAGDQWGYFQAKRLRGSLQRSTIDLLIAEGGAQPIDPARLRSSAEALTAVGEQEKARAGLLQVLDSAEGQASFALFSRAELPAVTGELEIDPAVRQAIDSLENAPEAEILDALAKIQDSTIADALHSAKQRARSFDQAVGPVNRQIEYLSDLLTKLSSPGSGDTRLMRDFTAARLKFAAARYDAEARLNQTVASIYELQVRKSNVQAERHHRRSQRFFFGMLGAQMAVIMSTFAMAARKRSLLWSFAAIAGVTALLFAAYVYLYV